MKQRKVLPAGFTLVEMSIVLLIAGLLLAAGMTMFRDYMQESQMIMTRNRLQDIDNAIIQYQSINGVLPCPASLTDQEGSATFGRQLTSPAYPISADCYAAVANAAGGAFKTKNGRKPPPPQLPVVNNSRGHLVMGAVPIRDLGLPDQEMVDAWNDRFVYAVTNTLTVAGGYDQTQGSIYIEDSKNKPVALPSGGAQYVIISYGADSAGAYTIDGVKSGIPCPAGALEQLNCTYPTSTFRQTTLNSNEAGDMFDDYVTFHTQVNATGTIPSGLVIPFATTPYTSPAPSCPVGWSSYPVLGDACALPSPANDYFPGPPVVNVYDYICCQKK